MDDLIKRLVGKTWYVCDSTGKRWADDAPMDAAKALLEAANALAEAKAQIARLSAENQRLKDAIAEYRATMAHLPDPIYLARVLKEASEGIRTDAAYRLKMFDEALSPDTTPA